MPERINDIIHNSRIIRDNQKIYIGASEMQQISGAQSASFSYSSQLSNLKVLGSNNIGLIKVYSGPKIGSSKIDTNLISEDIFLQYTGENPTNVLILEEKDSYEPLQCFYSGFLSSHTVNCSIGSPPNTSSTFQVIGDIGNVKTGDFAGLFDSLKYINSGEVQNYPLKIVTPGSIELNFEDIGFDRVQSFSVEYNVNRSYDYSIGEDFGASHLPFSVRTNYPIEVDVSVTIEIDQYSGHHLAEKLCNDNFQNASIILRDCEDNSIVSKYSFEDLHLISESVELNVDNNLICELGYKCWIFDR